MKINTRILLLVILLVLFAYALVIWLDNSPTGGDAYASPPVDPEIELAFDFAHALNMNDPRAYEMIAPNLISRLDEWMNSHGAQKCVGNELISSSIRAGTNLGKKITFSCFTETSDLSFEVDDIVIKDLKVIDWGEVREE